ncbi:GNAT superfamily N-acetyltransferase [Pseudomonas nitritireducens]|uniref:GNAT superfamily N-acetyltransferase n=1 Tax=Pseudomonas nitroreducens TaxID=46680 RepID=A0A7W7P2D5_PSENT|nr:GNAT family N-acetyltransferase [Pseudomonas nitritireducens]MBB4865476.1 GNAT superfamily N-acetyltransferase [Pseudomonas nitritireducens]
MTTDSGALPDSPFATFDVRVATAADAAALAPLLRQLGACDPLPDAALLALALDNHSPSRVTLVAERDGDLLGTCTLHLIEHIAHGFARSAILEDMVVDSRARGQGIGQALIGRAVEWARDRKCYKLALSSHQDREMAHRFYSAMGFAPHGVSLSLRLE